MPDNFEIKHYIWLIILVVATLFFAQQTGIQYALGVITAIVLRDGLILTALVWIATYKFRKQSWKWYDWLNMLAYTSLIASFLYPTVNSLIYHNFGYSKFALMGLVIITFVIVFIVLWFKDKNQTVKAINIKGVFSSIKNEKGLTSKGKWLVASILLIILAFPIYSIYEKIQISNLILASDNGEAYAQNRLGARYAEGDGVTKSDFKALDLFKKSAEQGFSKAQFNMGRMYYEGRGVPKNDKLAVYWLNKSAEQENENAQFILGKMYSEGIGVVQSIEMGEYYIKRAILNGSKEAKEYREHSENIIAGLIEVSNKLKSGEYD